MSKVTLEQIKGKVRGVEFTRIGITTTICMIVLENGFQVLGESACADPLEFDATKGEEYAYEAALSKIWPLEGYLLKERLHQIAIASHVIELKPKQLGFGSFEFALVAIKEGNRVARAGWNGKDQWVALSGTVEPREVAALHLGSPHARQFANDNGGVAQVAPGLILKNAQNILVMGWVPSTGDLLADDWCILPAVAK